MTLGNFLNTQPNRRYIETNCDPEFILMLNNNSSKFIILCEGKMFSSKSTYELSDWMEENFGIQFRICQHCGKPMFEGMTDLWDFYAHEDECFEKEMDETYGEWRVNETGEEGSAGGYYDYLKEDEEWVDTGIFYTEWY